MSDERRFVDPRTILARHALRPKRSFGQNFLVAGKIVEKIADLCVSGLDSPWIVEIGAGLGTLTAALLARADHVVAIERDRDMLPILQDELRADLERGALELVEADAAKVDLESLFDRAGSRPRVLAGNLPYQITGKLIERATELSTKVNRVVVMVQREVADRLIAPADGEAYGQLSVFVQAAFDVKRELLVSAGCFHPMPEVESAVVVMVPRATPRAVETGTFRSVVHSAFGARRKTLKNALGALIRADAVRAAVDATGIDLGRRGETLTVEEFDTLARAIERGRAL